jgi:hypothetical protein
VGHLISSCAGQDDEGQGTEDWKEGNKLTENQSGEEMEREEEMIRRQRKLLFSCHLYTCIVQKPIASQKTVFFLMAWV